MRPLKTAILLITCLAPCLAQSETLVIGPGDLLHVQVFDTPEMEQHSRVTDAGEAPLMFVGNVKVAGMTSANAARTIEDALKDKQFMRHPQVSVTVEKYATKQVSVMGQVNTPGAYEIDTGVPVITVLSLAGGLTDLADRHITIERQSDPTKTATYFLSNYSNVALNNSILVYPGDTVLVPSAGIVYVLGDVGRPGGYRMSGNDSEMTALQALAMAGAANKTAVLSKAKLIRKTPSGPKEVAIPIAAIQHGKQSDIQLQADDTIFIPFSYMKNVVLNGTQIAAAAASAAIYAKP